MNLNISEHIAYNQYKEKLKEIYDKLDEVIYLSNTIDYKKITILLAEIVQNFDYYKHHEEALATEATEATTVKVGGGDDEQDAPVEQDEQVAPVAPEKPYSLIEDKKTINHIIEGEEYKRLSSYIEKTYERINKKGDKLLELVKPFLEVYFKKPDSKMVNDDFVKQENNLNFKFDDIIANIDRIEHGIQDESREEAKIYVDLMSNQWKIKWWWIEYENNLDEFVGTWYWWYKRFVKNEHVVNKSKHSITKEDYKVFVEDNLYKKLFVELHKGFKPPPINQTKTFDTIKVLFEGNLKEVKEKIANAKAEEAVAKQKEVGAVAKEKEAEVDDTEKAKQQATPSIIIPKAKEEQSKPKQQEQQETKETPEQSKPEQQETKPEQQETKERKETKETKETPEQSKPEPLPTQETKPEQSEQSETKAPEVEAINRAFERKKAKVEEIKAIAEAKAIAIKKEKAIAEAKVKEAKAKAEEIAQSAQDARNLVLQKRQELTNTFKGMSNMKALQDYAKQVATAKVANAKQSTDRMNKLLSS